MSKTKVNHLSAAIQPADTTTTTTRQKKDWPVACLHRLTNLALAFGIVLVNPTMPSLIDPNGVVQIRQTASASVAPLADVGLRYVC